MMILTARTGCLAESASKSSLRRFHKDGFQASTCKRGVNKLLVGAAQRGIFASQPPKAFGLVRKGSLNPNLVVDFGPYLFMPSFYCCLIRD